ncbi:MAG TPA: Lpg1974 family pore-forming outer membrane protein [Candidatus Anammoximicrobium sp.]|nr:Lpg1974 family pore-forming outer membrane protein [Candidatus Anammoximicrobium sp.]
MYARQVLISIVLLSAIVAGQTATAQVYPTTVQAFLVPPPAERGSEAGVLRRLPRADCDVAASPLCGVQLVDYTSGGEAPAEGWTAEDKLCAECCPPFWAHRTGMFGEYLLLRPRGAEVPYAVPIDDALPDYPVQVAPVAIVDPDYSSGFRAGGSWALDQCTSIVATYTWFESHTSQAVGEDVPLVLRSLVTHPGTLNAAADSLSASADLNVDFQFADLDYRAIWWLGECSVVNWSVGARYAQLSQEFDSLFTYTGTLDGVASAVNFDGGGIRLGLDGERHHGSHGFLLYGKGVLSLIAGEFRASYFQGSDVDPEIVNTAWKAGRLVPILDLELGAGWQSPCGHFRFTAGYLVSMWFNTLTTDSWIRSVGQNNFAGQADAISYDTLTFDGLTARAEYRF